jgi:tRNA (guanine26-N2/guanine27-N2)-dimethyltransferase
MSGNEEQTEPGPNVEATAAPSGYTIHTENSARILLPSEATAFLNPIQEFNRDLSVACIKTWGKRWDGARRVRWESGKGQGKEGRGKKRKRGRFGSV